MSELDKQVIAVHIILLIEFSSGFRLSTPYTQTTMTREGVMQIGKRS